MILHLAEGIDPDKYRVKVLCLRKETPYLSEFIKRGVEISSLGMTRYFQFGPLREFYRYLRRQKIDLLHTHLYRDAVYGRFLGKLAGVKAVISTLHNSYVWRSRPQLFLDRLTSVWADKVVAVSDAVKRYAREKEHIPAGKLMTIYNGIETSRYRLPESARRDSRKEFRISEDELVVGSVGHLTRQKGYRYLLEAAPEIIRKYPRVRFLLAGEGELEDKLRDQCRQAGIEDRVTFIGYREDIPRVLSAFDIFVLPSLWEGLPVVLIEALAAGLPIVATDVDGNTEVTGREETGLTVSPRAPGSLSRAILSLLAQPELREQLGQAGRLRAEKLFDVKIMVQRYEQLYDNLIVSSKK